ncbi:MAG: hypothetical protein LBQ79_12045 [Deltaproteobacteria bacterium]|jgi:alpha-glucosidase|nr:hypothetical protein [Deltaproteobacteria bacterium]
MTARTPLDPGPAPGAGPSRNTRPADPQAAGTEGPSSPGTPPRAAGTGPEAPAGLLPSLAAALCLAAGLLLLSAGEALAAPHADQFGPYTLTQDELKPGLWYFQIFERAPDNKSAPYDPLKSPPKSILISPMLKNPEMLTSKTPTRPFPVTVKSGRPELRITTGEGESLKTVFVVSPYSPDGRLSGVVFYRDAGSYTFAAGLGAQLDPLAEGLNLLGKTIMPSGPHGPQLKESEYGTMGSLQIPICYFLGEGRETAAFFMNETRPLAWDFSASPWTVSLSGPLNPERSLSFFVITGEDLPSVRRSFMELVGRPPVPPRSVFAPWIIDTKTEPAAGAATVLRGWKTRFTLIPTIGGLFRQDPSHLPHELAAQGGAHIMAPETPYVPLDSPLYANLRTRGFLVREGWAVGEPAVVNFMGKPSALIDYTNPDAASLWHSLSRSDSYGKGARVFFFTGGEPEIASPLSWYQGNSDPEAHSQYAWANRYLLKWMEGFNLAVKKNSMVPNSRTFLMVRSGMGGMGRHGAGLYTQDPSWLTPVAGGQARSQSSLSGVDYYTTDATPYLAKSSPDGPFRSLYELWGARNILLNLPLIIPDVLIDEPWVKQLVEFKSSLEPYVYSLAHETASGGEPIAAPLVYAFQDDIGTRARSSEFMLGRWILIGAGLGGLNREGMNLETAHVYVPEGRWYDYFAREVVTQKEYGELLREVTEELARNTDGPPDQAVIAARIEETREIPRPGKVNGSLMPPVLLREGAIVPSRRPGRPESEELSVKIFPGRDPSTFTLYEDDGVSDPTGFSQRVMTTAFELSSVPNPDPAGNPVIRFTIRARKGHMPDSDRNPKRRFILEFVGIDNHGNLTLDGEDDNRLDNPDQLELAETGWTSRGTGTLTFKTKVLDLTQDHTFVVR